MIVASIKRFALSVCVFMVSFILAFSAVNAHAKSKRLFVQYQCDVSNGDVSVTTFDINQAIALRKDPSNHQHPDQRNFDFDDHGILFNRPPMPDVADYSDIKEIRYAVDKGNKRGYLTVVTIMHDGSLDDETLGYIDEACWNVLSNFLKKDKAKVKLVVGK